MEIELPFSDNVNEILTYSREEAQRLGNQDIGPEHLFLGILRTGDGSGFNLLTSLGMDLVQLKRSLESSLRSTAIPVSAPLPMLSSTERILKFTQLEARIFHSPTADSDHMLLAILKDKSNLASELLNTFGVTYDRVRGMVEGKDSGSLLGQNEGAESDDLDEDAFSMSGMSGSKSNQPESKTPALDSFGIDLTDQARQGNLDPMVGRNREVEQVLQILGRRKKNNPVLIGEAGVGKSAIVEGLAQRIVRHEVPYEMLDKRIVSLNMASLVAGTKYRGQFEERLQKVLRELEDNRDVILFIDEIHTVIGAGGAAGSLDAANIMKPALSRGKIQCIGASTIDEYRQSVEKDAALERRFQKVLVNPTSRDETLEILKNLRKYYEEHHHVIYTDAALEACVRLTDRYVHDRQFPDKAIDAMDEAGARTHVKNVDVPDYVSSIESEIKRLDAQKADAVAQGDYKTANELRKQVKAKQNALKEANQRWRDEHEATPTIIDAETIAELIALTSGIPAQRIATGEKEKLTGMTKRLQEKVIGQDHAIDTVCRAIMRNRIGLKDPGKPIGSFLFLGPTGVGKTYLTKMLAEDMFDSRDAIIRIDMSEYMEKFSVSRLIGAPPGYVGYNEGGQLTEKVRWKPYSIVLFDEIEKAHPDVYNLLLQVLDEGCLTDSLGRKVDFKNTIIIMTSNVGSRQLKDFKQGIGFSPVSVTNHSDYAQGIVQKALNKTFSPEFLNRIDEIVYFDPLQKDSIIRIIDTEWAPIQARVEKMGYNIGISDEAKNFLAEKGYDVQYGARPIKRMIQKHVEDVVASTLMNGVPYGATIHIELNEAHDGTVCTITPGATLPIQEKETIEATGE